MGAAPASGWEPSSSPQSVRKECGKTLNFLARQALLEEGSCLGFRVSASPLSAGLPVFSDKMSLYLMRGEHAASED